jgi:hypothetical protein
MASSRSPNESEIAALLDGARSRVGLELEGPIRLRSSARAGSGWRCEITAQHLVPVDPGEPGRGGIFVAVPVNGSVEVGDDGALARASLAPPGADAVREARAFAEGLLAQGAVRGADTAPRTPRGPRGRPTHELRTDASGRRVIHRIGFDGS